MLAVLTSRRRKTGMRHLLLGIVLFGMLGLLQCSDGGTSSSEQVASCEGIDCFIGREDRACKCEGEQCRCSVNFDAQFLNLVSTDITFVIDMSGSMTTNPFPDECSSSNRWDAVRDALKTLLPNLQKHGHNYSLIAFPINVKASFITRYGRQLCGRRSDVEDAPASPANHTCEVPAEPQIIHGANLPNEEVTAWLDETEPDPLGHTPIYQALEVAKTHLQNNAQFSRPQLLVLMLDGSSNCGYAPERVAGLIAQIRGESGIDTAVLGIESDGFQVIDNQAQTLRTQLNLYAQAGGREFHDPEKSNDKARRFYDVRSQDEIAKALKGLSLSAANCRFELSDIPDNFKLEGVYLDGKTIERNTTHGWEVKSDRSELKFFGSACEVLQRGNANLVRVDWLSPRRALLQ